jgi:hypothetical protein
MNNKQDTVDNIITEYICDDNYIRFLLQQLDNINESLSSYEQYVKTNQHKQKRKPTKLETVILDFTLARKDEINLSQDHHDDLDLISELIMLNDEGTL